MKITEQKTLNGMKAAELSMSINDMKNNPGLGKYKFRASNKWVNGTHCCTAIKSFCAGGKEDTTRKKAHILEADEPAPLLGQDYGPNATEALLYALASCLNTSFICHATAQGVKIDELEFELEGEIDLNGFFGLDESVRNGYQNINVTCKVTADAPKEKLQELCECAQKRSPVFDIVTHEVPVTVKLET